MSHFGVLVVGDVEEQLAPFHEYECTGIQDQYVEHIDITEKEYQEWLDLSEETKKEYKLENFKQYLSEYCEYKQLPLGTRGDSRYFWWDTNFIPAIKLSDEPFVSVFKYTNPNSEWDWYVIGGRWTGYLLHKNGNKVDSLTKGDWAIDQIIDKATAEANKEFDRFEEVTKDLPMARTWIDLLNDNSFNDMKERREFYHSQPMVKAWDEANKDVWFNDFEPFSKGREYYIESQVLASLIPYAYVKDQIWKAKGKMGWWGISTNEVEDELSWRKEVLKEIQSLPDDTIITIVDCHI